MQAITIPTPPEFSFRECLRFLARSRDECTHTTARDSVLKLLEMEDKFMLIRVRSADKCLVVEFLNGAPAATAQERVREYVSDWFDLSTDLRPFYALAAKDRVLRMLCSRHFGLRLLAIQDLFEAVSWAIIGQQINLPFAYTLKRRFVSAFGKEYHYRGKCYYMHPSPERVASLDAGDLIPLQFSRSKAAYVVGFAREMSNGNITTEGLRQLPFGEARSLLTSVRGIGNWTANYVLMKSLKHKNAFPVEDVGLHNAIRKQLGLAEKPSIASVKELSESWNGWEAYATFYLWHSLLTN